MTFAVEHETQHIKGCFFRPAQRNGGTARVNRHERFHQQARKIGETVFAFFRIAADGEVTFGGAVGVVIAAAGGRVIGQVHIELSDERLGFLTRDGAALDVLIVQALQCAVNGADAVGQELEAQKDALQAFVKTLCGLARHAAADGGKTLKLCTANRVFAGARGFFMRLRAGFAP